MKKFLPFVFPAAAFVVVLFLATRWYGMRNNPSIGDAASSGEEGVQIENLTEAERNKVMMGVGDYETSSMKVVGEDTEAMGDIRYDVEGDKVNMSVVAGLPMLENGTYQVWFQKPDSTTWHKAFVLEFTKGGFYGTAAIPVSELPLKVAVSREFQDDQTIELVVLEGELKKPTE
jgi:hypothetical protein